ncbi:hypothetical protein AB1N83_013986 [Pleurotus pulmonarius]
MGAEEPLAPYLDCGDCEHKMSLADFCFCRCNLITLLAATYSVHWEDSSIGERETMLVAFTTRSRGEPAPHFTPAKYIRRNCVIYY